MNITQYALTKRVITYVFIVAMISGGLFSYEKLGRLEDPEFTIKDALVITPYPGATAEEVEQEVTDKLEIAIQSLAQLKRVESESTPGLSQITVSIKDKYNKDTLPQVWDELRRKIGDIQDQLPPGAGPSTVYDDYGDVYGIIFAIYGEDFSMAELKKEADYLKKELLLVNEVAKVEIKGIQPEVIYVELSTERLAALGISRERVAQVLKEQNLVSPAGKVQVGDKFITIVTSGNFATVESIENLVLQGLAQNNSRSQIYLKDVASVTRGYVDPPKSTVTFNGQPALALGISIIPGGNVVRMGEAVKKRLAELERNVPAGIKIGIMSFQSDNVSAAINNFVVSLVEALAIVIVVLFVFMGWRSGLLIAAALLITILGTFIFMYMWKIDLQRISLGALIIALGMLVDNAIVVTEGVLIRVEMGEDPTEASIKTVQQTQWPLFGATLVGILAFAGIGLSQDSTGEYCGSLFQVIFISLMLSWLVAVTVSPFLCVRLFKGIKKKDPGSDPYAGFIYQTYKNFLNLCIRLRVITCLVTLGLLILGFIGFGYVKQSFFPDSTQPQFYIDYWLPQGTFIGKTNEDISQLSDFIDTLPGVVSTSAVASEGTMRFMLTYKPEKKNDSYGFILVTLDDYIKIDDTINQVRDYVDQNFPQAHVELRKFVLGTGGGSSIKFRIYGQDLTELRKIADSVEAIVQEHGNYKNLRNNMREKVPQIVSQINEQQSRLTGIARPDVNSALQSFFLGETVGIYREKDLLLPIKMRVDPEERVDVNNINNIEVWSPVYQKTVPIRQIVSSFDTEWQDDIIRRRDRKRIVEVMLDPKTGTANALLHELMPKIESLKLPSGYEIIYGGEYEDSNDARAGLIVGVSLSFLFMVLIVILLFNAIRQPFIVFIVLPLAIVGVTAGLLITNQPFGFMALLGLLSLTGMMIKNTIVLLDQIDLEIAEGKEHYKAILDSSVSRMRPVMMAALTTALGMIPLIFDAFFVSMAITIIFGLCFATLLTLIFVPVLYAILFRIKSA